MHGPLNVRFTYEATQYIPPKTWYSPGNSNHRRRIVHLHGYGTLNVMLVTVFFFWRKNKLLNVLVNESVKDYFNQISYVDLLKRQRL